MNAPKPRPSSTSWRLPPWPSSSGGRGQPGRYMIQILNLSRVNIIQAEPEPDLPASRSVQPGPGGIHGYRRLCLLDPDPGPEQKEMLFILEPAYDWVQSAEAPFFVAVVAGGLIAGPLRSFGGHPPPAPRRRLPRDGHLGFAEIVRVVAMNIPRVTNGALGSKASRIMPTSGGISAGASSPCLSSSG